MARWQKRWLAPYYKILGMKFRLFRRGNAPDYVLITITFLLVIFGLVMLASASSDLAKRKFDNSYFYLKHQILYGASLGIAGFWLTSKIYYKKTLKQIVKVRLNSLLAV